jgi:hypothetical protein
MTGDLYSTARVLATELWDQGFKEWTDRIDNVIKGWSTGTEILMGLRWAFAQILQEESRLSGDLRSRVEVLEREIAKILL